MKYFILILTVLMLCGKSIDAQQRRDLDNSNNRNSFTLRHEMKNTEHHAPFIEPDRRERSENSFSEMTFIEKGKFEAPLPGFPQSREEKKSNGDRTSQMLHKPLTVNINDGEERYTYTYDANGNMLTSLQERWNNDAWQINQHFTCTYDANGNV